MENNILRKKLMEQLQAKAMEQKISDASKEYLGGKGFSEEFLNKLPYGIWRKRVQPIFDAKDEVIKLLEGLGGVYKKPMDAIGFDVDGVWDVYFFGKIPEEFPEQTVGDIVELLKDKEVTTAWKKYLGTYWITKPNYYGYIDKESEKWKTMTEEEKFQAEENARGIRRRVENFALSYLPMYQTKEELEELRRFELHTSQVMQDLTNFELEKDEALKDVEQEDLSRSIDLMNRTKRMLEIKHDPMLELMFRLTKATNILLMQTHPFDDPRDFIGPMDNPIIYMSIEEINEKVRSCMDIIYTDKAGNKKKANDWNRLARFVQFYKDGEITKDELQFICVVSDQSLNSYFEKCQ